MQQSMTGYGRDERVVNGLQIRTEIKTLNSKFLDFSPRLSKELTSKEGEIKSIVSNVLSRGKVMLSLDLNFEEEGKTVAVNEELFQNYFQEFQRLALKVGGELGDLTKIALLAPDVIKNQELDKEDLPWEDIKESLNAALQGCVNYRETEGAALEIKLKEYTKEITQGLQNIIAVDSQRIDRIKARIEKNLEEIADKVKIDQNRLEQELIFYVERLDITEEKVRLQNHLEYIEQILSTESLAGKKLGFIAQEIGREINTIGSKANDTTIQQTVVGMKDELEKIKEQVLNIV